MGGERVNRLRSVLVLATFAIGACGGEPSKAAATGDAHSGADVSRGRDLTEVNVCELVPDALVAETVGGTVKQAGSRSDYGASQGCDYEISGSTKSGYEYVSIWLGPPEQFEDPESILETDRGLGQEADMENVAGLGDEAFVIHNRTERQSTLHVLRRDDVSLSVTAANLTHARQLGELVLERVGSR